MNVRDMSQAEEWEKTLEAWRKAAPPRIQPALGNVVIVIPAKPEIGQEAGWVSMLQWQSPPGSQYARTSVSGYGPTPEAALEEALSVYRGHPHIATNLN